MLKKRKSDAVIAFDLGGTKLASAVVTRDGEILAEHREPVDFEHGKKGFLDFLARRAKVWMMSHPQVKALGIASCGPLDSEKGILLQPTNFPRWGNIALRDPLSRALRLPVGLQNDAAAAALAEGWVGGAKKLQNWTVLTLGTGLGTGIVMDRKVFMGGSGFGPEAGHMIVTDKPYLCGCGNTGCAEAVLSGTALRNRVKERGLPYSGSHALVAAAQAGEPRAKEVFVEYAAVLARVVHNVAVMYKPQVVFFSGGLAEGADLFLRDAEVQAARLLKGRRGFMPKLMVSKHRNELGVLGGAHVGFAVIGGSLI